MLGYNIFFDCGLFCGYTKWGKLGAPSLSVVTFWICHLSTCEENGGVIERFHLFAAIVNMDTDTMAMNSVFVGLGLN